MPIPMPDMADVVLAAAAAVAVPMDMTIDDESIAMSILVDGDAIFMSILNVCWNEVGTRLKWKCSS